MVCVCVFHVGFSATPYALRLLHRIKEESGCQWERWAPKGYTAGAATSSTQLGNSIGNCGCRSKTSKTHGFLIISETTNEAPATEDLPARGFLWHLLLCWLLPLRLLLLTPQIETSVVCVRLCCWSPTWQSQRPTLFQHTTHLIELVRTLTRHALQLITCP